MIGGNNTTGAAASSSIDGSKPRSKKRRRRGHKFENQQSEQNAEDVKENKIPAETESDPEGKSKQSEGAKLMPEDMDSAEEERERVYSDDDNNDDSTLQHH
eukprot:475222-Karenia_brevis.AAC.1